jgi:putative addiction module antidote
LTALKVRRIGNSLGLVLPKEEIGMLNVAEGDTVYITRAPGGARLTSHDPNFERQMEFARKIMKENVNVLRELAK